MPHKGYRHTEESKVKIREARKKQLPTFGMLGKKRSVEAKEKTSIALIQAHKNKKWGFEKGKTSFMKGKKQTKESIEKNRLSHIGHKHSEETKKKMSMRKHTEERKVLMKQKMTGHRN